MTTAETICAKVNKDIKPQAITLANAVLALQAKLEEQRAIYEQMPLAQTVKLGSGETILRQNPMTQEFRATAREYANLLKELNEILNANGDTTSTTEIKPVTIVGNSRWKRA